MDNKIQLCTSTNQNKLGPLKNYIGCIINCKRTLIYFDTCSDRFWRNKNRLKLDFRNVCQKNQTYNRIAFIPPTTHTKKQRIHSNKTKQNVGPSRFQQLPYISWIFFPTQIWSPKGEEHQWKSRRTHRQMACGDSTSNLNDLRWVPYMAKS